MYLRVLTFLLITTSCFAQKEALNWYFGYHTGLNFSTTPPTLTTNSASNSTGGMAVMSDSTGQLLFYTDGITVWDATHKAMPNGSGLKGHQGTAQSTVIVPIGTETKKKYYIFTSDGATYIPGYENDSVFAYSIVDMSLNNGKGDITVKNNVLMRAVNECVAAVKHVNGIDTWVMTHQLNTNAFYAYLVSTCGISPPIISLSGPVLTNYYQSYLKFSPNGQKATYLFGPGYRKQYLFDFDASTGFVTNPIYLGDLSGANGCSFSPNNRYLYTAGGTLPSGGQSNLNQYDLWASDIPSSLKTRPDTTFEALQLGLDGKLYIMQQGGGHPRIDVLHNPNDPLDQANYQQGAYSIASSGTVYGLPNFIESYFNPGYHDTMAIYPAFIADRVCVGDSTSFNITNNNGQLFHWNFGDPSSGVKNQSSSLHPKHLYSAAGNYIVTCIADNSICNDTLSQTIIVDSLPFVSLGNDINRTSCNDASITLDAGKGFLSYLWQDNSQNQTFTATDKGIYSVTVTNSCASYTASIVISKNDIKIPNLITPNNDNKNDTFEIKSLGEKGKLSIWNTWGTEIYKNDAYDNSWNASSVEAGIYYFSYQLADCPVYTGWLQVLK
ncbi:MAG: hypothetical protein JWO58_2535 [Chitinophagaceae bacterium]|nr:hypothetical protein [Chitinophagaceae bacterium]